MQSLFASTSTSPCNLDIKYLFLILLDTSRTKRLKILAMGILGSCGGFFNDRDDGDSGPGFQISGYSMQVKKPDGP